jgi:hypothetical protein
MPDRSFLDGFQILQHAYDDATQRLRVDALITANISGAQEIIISHVDDSIKVGDGTDFLAIDADGSANVRITSSALPTGASTSANQTTEIASLSSIDGKLTTTNSSLASIDAGIPVSLGQTIMSASMPVVIASDQSPVPVSQSGTWNINNISGTVSLPTGAATEATLALVLAELISTTGVVTAVPFSLVVQTALAANAARKGVFAYNATNKRVLVKLGSAASASSYSFVLGSGGLYERELTNYRGVITVIWDSPATGDLLMTELT